MPLIPKTFFCKLLGCTWQHHVDDPKTVWTASKNMCELEQESAPLPLVRSVRGGHLS